MFVASSPCLKSVQPVKYSGGVIFSWQRKWEIVIEHLGLKKHYFDNQEKCIWASLVLISSATNIPNVSQNALQNPLLLTKITHWETSNAVKIIFSLLFGKCCLLFPSSFSC